MTKYNDFEGKIKIDIEPLKLNKSGYKIVGMKIGGGEYTPQRMKHRDLKNSIFIYLILQDENGKIWKEKISFEESAIKRFSASVVNLKTPDKGIENYEIMIKIQNNEYSGALGDPFENLPNI